jgi:hypothetical protein
VGLLNRPPHSSQGHFCIHGIGFYYHKVVKIASIGFSGEPKNSALQGQDLCEFSVCRANLCTGPLIKHQESAFISSRQKSGISATTRPHTRFPSRKAGASTHVAPAFCKSSLIPVLPVMRLPMQIPALAATQPAWQINPMIFFYEFSVET